MGGERGGGLGLMSTLRYAGSVWLAAYSDSAAVNARVLATQVVVNLHRLSNLRVQRRPLVVGHMSNHGR